MVLLLPGFEFGRLEKHEKGLKPLSLLAILVLFAWPDAYTAKRSNKKRDYDRALHSLSGPW